MSNNINTQQTRKPATGFSDYCILLHLFFVKNDHAYSIRARICNKNNKYIPILSTFNSAFAKLKSKGFISPVQSDQNTDQKTITCFITDEGKILLDKLHKKFSLRENASWKKIAEIIYEQLKDYNESFYKSPLPTTESINSDNIDFQDNTTLQQNENIKSSTNTNIDMFSNIQKSINGENLILSNFSNNNFSNSIYDDNFIDDFNSEDINNLTNELNSSINYFSDFGYKRNSNNSHNVKTLNKYESEKQELFNTLKQNPEYKENFKNFIINPNSASNNFQKQELKNESQILSNNETINLSPTINEISKTLTLNNNDILNNEETDIPNNFIFETENNSSSNLILENKTIENFKSDALNINIQNFDTNTKQQISSEQQTTAKKSKQINNLARKFNTNYKIDSLTNYYNSSSANLTVSLVFLSMITLLQITSIIIFKDLNNLPLNFVFLILGILQFLFFLVRFLNNNIIKKELKSNFFQNYLTSLIAFVIPTSILFCSMLIKNQNIEFLSSSKFIIMSISFFTLTIIPFINIIVLNILKRRKK